MILALFCTLKKNPCVGGNLLRMVVTVVAVSLLVGLPSTLIGAEQAAQSAPLKREPPRAFDHFKVTFLPPSTAVTNTPKAIPQLWQHVVFSKKQANAQAPQTEASP